MATESESEIDSDSDDRAVDAGDSSDGVGGAGVRDDGLDGADPETRALALEEARTTFDYQVERLREIDAKAIEILKANLLIIGVFVTGLSVVGQTEIDVQAFVNPHTVSGAVLMLVSTAIAGVTYTTSNLRGGVGRDALETALSDAAFAERLVRSYGEWIEYNAAVTAVNDVLVTITVLLIVDSFVYVVVGIGVGAANLSPIGIWASFAGLTLVLGYLTHVAYQMDHVGSVGSSEDPTTATFDGVRLSKGATRGQSHDALRRTVRARDERTTEAAERERKRHSREGKT
ncbi:hypothetical protein [Halopiger thermotolerans]